jgi:hypothetical protein
VQPARARGLVPQRKDDAVNRTVLEIVRAVAEQKVTRGTVSLAKHILARELAPAPAKRPIPSVEHQERTRRAEEREREEVSDGVWRAVLERAGRARGDYRCELCGLALPPESLEPHHLEMGSGKRRQQETTKNVMAVCRSCHDAYHMSERAFVPKVRAWCAENRYPLPNRKAFRDA